MWCKHEIWFWCSLHQDNQKKVREIIKAHLPDDGRFWKYGCRLFVGEPSHNHPSSLSSPSSSSSSSSSSSLSTINWKKKLKNPVKETDFRPWTQLIQPFDKICLLQEIRISLHNLKKFWKAMLYEENGTCPFWQNWCTTRN